MRPQYCRMHLYLQIFLIIIFFQLFVLCILNYCHLNYQLTDIEKSSMEKIYNTCGIKCFQLMNKFLKKLESHEIINNCTKEEFDIINILTKQIKNDLQQFKTYSKQNNYLKSDIFSLNESSEIDEQMSQHDEKRVSYL